MTGDLGSFTSKHLRSRWYSLARTVIRVSEWSGVMAVTSHVTKNRLLILPLPTSPNSSTAGTLDPGSHGGGELVAVIFALGRTVFEINGFEDF